MNKNSTIQLHTNRTMPIMGLGTWQLTQDAVAMILYAFDLGYRLIDTSSDYGTQSAIGEAIKKSRIPREYLYIITKIEETDDAFRASKNYIKEMGLDYADLILIHRPPADDKTSEVLWKGLMKARAEGITKDIGVSNYSIKRMQKLILNTGEIPTVNQIEWSPFGHSQMMLDYCKKNNIIIQAYSPLTRGNLLADASFTELSKKYNKSSAQIIIRWNLQIGTVPIPKANQKIHMQENFDVFDFNLTDEEIEYLSSLNEDYSALGSLPYEQKNILTSQYFKS